jgi:hypothetical protein
MILKMMISGALNFFPVDMTGSVFSPDATTKRQLPVERLKFAIAFREAGNRRTMESVE